MTWFLFAIAIALVVYIIQNVIRNKRLAVSDALAALGIIAALITASNTLPTKQNISDLSPDKALDVALQWPITYNDSFDDSEQYWRDADGTTSEEVTVSFDGIYNIEANNSQKKVIRVAFYNDKADAPRTYLLSMDVVGLKGCDIGLTFRGNLDGEFYIFSAGREKYEVAKRTKADGRKSYFDRTDLTTSTKDLHSLHVLADKSKYRLYINKEFVYEFDDSTLDGSRVGVEVLVCQYVEKAKFQFDNFKVQAP